MTNQLKSTSPPSRARSLRTAAAVGAVVLAAGATTLAITSTAAQASTGTFAIFSQINNTGLQPTPTSNGSKTITMTVTPTTAAPGDPVEVVVTSPDFAVTNGPAVSANANAEELDAVIALGGVDYVLRGSQNGQNVGINQTLFNSGWVVSSTPGNSSSTSTNASSSAGPPVITAGTVAGTTGLGTAVRGAEATIVPLVAPAAPATYTIGLKALVLNSIAGSGTPALTDNFDSIMNTDSTSPSVSFAANVQPSNDGTTAGGGNFVFATPVTLTVAAASQSPTESVSQTPTESSGSPSATESTPPVDVPSGAIGGLGLAVLAAVAGLGAYAWSRRPRKVHGHE